MPALLTALLKINLVLLFFAAGYYVVLRQLTFYHLNRMFLVFGILFATAYPFIDFTELFYKFFGIGEAGSVIPKLNTQVKALVPQQLDNINWTLVTALFYTGVICMAARLSIQFFGLYRMHKNSSPGHLNGFPVRILQEEATPFSFWQTVYVNPEMHRDQALQTILEHENAHVKGWHSLDIILAEISLVCYWFNPGVWLMKNAVKENLEFITDAKVLKKGFNKKAYQYSLLQVGHLPALGITNNFSLSGLKTRIRMMNTKRSSKGSLARYLFILPLLLAGSLAFTVSEKTFAKPLDIFKPETAPVIAPRQTSITVKAPEKKTRRTRAHMQQQLATVVPDTTGTTRINISGRTEGIQIAVPGHQIKTADSATVVIGKPTQRVQGIRLEGKPLSNSTQADAKDISVVQGFKRTDQ